jgi:chemotaxis protein CheD
MLTQRNSNKEKQAVHVNIGQLYASNSGDILKTLLGSCVSACLFDPEAKVGGMNHILLSSHADMQKFDANARYGIHAMEILINEMCKLGAKRHRLQAKAFGGGNVLTTVTKEDTPGKRNIEFMTDYLKMENIPLLAHDFGGPFTRVLYFHTDSFNVFVKKTKPSEKKLTISQEDAIRRQKVVENMPDSEITLFE